MTSPAENQTDYGQLDPLVSPFGIVASVRESASRWTPVELRRFQAMSGSGYPGRSRDKPTLCGGRAWESAPRARMIAIAEAAERYSARDFLGEERVWARADELDGPVLDPRRYPRCSTREYAHPRCPVRPFDPDTRIRWVRGVDLATKQPTWLPACMATYGLDAPSPGERFSVGLSTGYAVHSDPCEALVRGLLEVVERDANAVLWLQRLPLPPVAPEVLCARTVELIEWSRLRFVHVDLFDATTDVGIPVTYCLLRADHDDVARRIVAASAGRSLTEAAHAAVVEALPSRDLFHTGDGVPDDVADFAIEDGGRYLGRPERAHAFDFLTDGVDERRPSRRTDSDLSDDPAAALAQAVARLTALDMPVVAVDRTTSELADVGLTAVNVVVPDLQPMSLRPLAQFRAHPRLFRAPKAMGYHVLDEKDLHPWPQPFI